MESSLQHNLGQAKVTQGYSRLLKYPYITGLFHFLSIQQCERQIPWGCARSIFQGGTSGTKLSFRGGQDKFSRGVIPRKLVAQGWFLVLPPGIPVSSGPKMNLENCLPHPCMEKKWNSPFAKRMPGGQKRSCSGVFATFVCKPILKQYIIRLLQYIHIGIFKRLVWFYVWFYLQFVSWSF